MYRNSQKQKQKTNDFVPICFGAKVIRFQYNSISRSFFFAIQLSPLKLSRFEIEKLKHENIKWKLKWIDCRIQNSSSNSERIVPKKSYWKLQFSLSSFQFVFHSFKLLLFRSDCWFFLLTQMKQQPLKRSEKKSKSISF